MNPQEDIEQEICDYLEGTLAPERQNAFEARLAEDPDAMDLLCTHSLISAGMTQPLAAPEKRTEELLEQQKRKALRISLAIAAAVAMAAAFTLHQIMVPAPTAWANIESAPGTVFSIQSSGAGDQDGHLDFGETLVVSQGTAEITLGDGSRCIAEAPARVTLRDKAHAHLSRGRAYFDIAKGSEGFVVTTRDMEIVDLGTAFGVDDRAEYQPEVHVVTGKVRATALSGRRESAELNAGDAMAIGAAGTLRPIPSNGFGFFKQLPSSLPSAQFTFDPNRKKKLEARGSIATHESIRLLGADAGETTPKRIKGHLGGGLRFKKRSDRMETTWSGIGGSVPRTISLWVRIPEGSEGGTILGWGLGGGSRQMSDLRVTYSGDALANLRLSSGRRWLQTARRLDTGKWHHVAFLIDSPDSDRWPTVKCYVDGKLEPLTPRVAEDGEVAPFDSYGTVTDHPESRPLTFGDLSKDRSGTAFTGDLDEVVITAGLMTEKHIRSQAKRPE